jgi:integrase
MPHFPKPFYRKGRGTWSVQIQGKQINLGKDKEEAFKIYHRLMSEQGGTGGEPTSPSLGGLPVAGAHPLVASLLDQYLDWLSHRVKDGTRAPRTFEWSRDHLQSFLASLTDPETLTVDQLAPFHIHHWVDSKPGWKTGKRGAMGAIQTALNWAAKMGLLKSIGGRSPLAGLERPPAGRRERLISQEEYEEALSLVKDQPFRDLLVASWETGARPQELFKVEGAFVLLGEHPRWVFPLKLSKGRKVQRVVYLSERALEITKRLMGANPSGPLFRDGKSRPWDKDSAHVRFQEIRHRLGRKKLGPEVKGKLERRKAARKAVPPLSLYLFRHSWITRALASGLDAVTVSVLAGHVDTGMISKVYSHLTQLPAHLSGQVRKISGA